MYNDKILILVKKTALIINKIANQILAPYNLTPTQFKILIILYTYSEKNFRQIDIEKFFSLTNPSVTGILNNLEKKGLIKRIKNPSDARSKYIVLTEAALEKKEEMLRLSQEIENKLTKNLSNDENIVLTDLLKKIIDDDIINV